MMMSDPFAVLGNDKEEKLPDYELVGGAMSCQTTGCFEVAHEAKYFEDAALLTWKCNQGHISKIAEFKI